MDELKAKRSRKNREYIEAFDAAIERIESDDEVSGRYGSTRLKGHLARMGDIEMLRLVAEGTMDEIIEELG